MVDVANGYISTHKAKFNNIFENSFATEKMATADYPATCDRGNDPQIQPNQITTRCMAAPPFSYAPVTCQSRFGQTIKDLGIGFKYTPANCMFQPGNNPGMNATCTQVSWDKKFKESCCSGSLDLRLACDPTWCPMSKGCADSKATIRHCSGADANGKPMISTNRSCRNWCKDNMEICNQAKDEFCVNNPGSKECACMRPQDQKEFKEFQEDMLSIGIPLPTIPTYCWFPGCAGSDLQTVLKTTNILTEEKKCTPQTLVMCNQIISAQRGTTHNVVNGNTFQQVCNVKLPGYIEPDKKPGDDGDSGGTKTPDKPPSIINTDTKTLKLLEFAIGGIAIALIILLVLQMKRARA